MKKNKKKEKKGDEKKLGKIWKNMKKKKFVLGI